MKKLSLLLLMLSVVGILSACEGDVPEINDPNDGANDKYKMD